MMLLVAILGLLVFAAPAFASKEAVAFFPSDSGDIVVNSTGAGPADAGDIYVLGDNRVQRFTTDGNGTPAEPYDDTYPFVAAWGAGVLSGGTDYEICTVEASCQAGVAAGGNGTPAGNGSLDATGSGGSGNGNAIAVDQDTGAVYVSDQENARVNVYAGDGTFLRSFGWDVVGAGPGDAGTGYEICVAANGDVCKTGTHGSGLGQIGAGNGIAISPADSSPSSGSVFLTDSESQRVNTYGLDGAAPAHFGSAADFPVGPFSVAVDSQGIVYTDCLQGGDWVIARYDSQNANGGGVGFLASIAIPPLLPLGSNPVGLEIDPDSDGGGIDEDTLYVLRDPPGEFGTVVQQFGPLNDPGLTAPPAAADDVHGSQVGFSFIEDLGLDESSGRLFVTPRSTPPKNGVGFGTYVLDIAGGGAPTAQIDSITDITSTTATVNGTVNPNGAPPVSYSLEYSLNGTDWKVDPSSETVLGTQTTPQSVSAVLNPPGFGLEAATEYHVRLAATKVFTPPVISSATTVTTLSAPPHLETTGAPIRSVTTAQLTGRVNPRGSATEYHFEYGTLGPCSTNPCISTPDRPAGAGQLVRLIAEEIAGLSPDTTYHHRVVADNGAPGSPVVGEDMTVTTRASNTLSHGRFPGPPGSDRAWEQVNSAETSGNPIAYSLGFSDEGDRAIYSIAGGTPNSSVGSVFGILATERPSGTHPRSGWEARALEPPRSQLDGVQWMGVTASDDLEAVFGVNHGVESERLFRMAPDGPFAGLHESVDWGVIAVSEDGSRVVATLTGSHDPAHPASGSQLYDLSFGTPRLLSILPDGSVSTACGQLLPGSGGVGLPPTRHTSHWVSADGSRVFFDCGDLYVRNIEAEATKLVGVGGDLIKSTPDAAFFFSPVSFDPQDNGGKDIYRYDLETEARECVTCVVAGLEADVTGAAVAEDGSRVYFKSANVLAPGAAPDGIYRVDVDSGGLAYVASIGASSNIGDARILTRAITPDGSVLIFGSEDPSLNPLGEGTDNGGTFQYYRYDDDDRTLICVSCPPDGSPPLAAVPSELGDFTGFIGEAGPNMTPLAADGTFSFSTTTPLVNVDQNTPGPGHDPARGTDVYEWRDGRLLLVTDGITISVIGKNSAPRPVGMTPSGRDLFFLAAAQLTPDALEPSYRLYTARIGGGIDFPQPPVPCPLEVCQGTPNGAPEEQAPGTGFFAGPGNKAAQGVVRCGKGRRKVRRAGRARCVKKRRGGKHRAANSNRRAKR
jgi:hypothetical protein